MTWSNVGDEPGRLTEKRSKKTPSGRNYIAKGKQQFPGGQRPEPPMARRERLRRIARG